MARHTFGAGAADVIFTVDSSTADMKEAPGVVVQMFSALSGGTLITDLLDNTGTPITFVTTDSNGFLPVFSGPDTAPTDTMKMAADASGGAGPRYWIFCTDKDAQLNALQAQVGTVTGEITSLQAQTPVFNYYNAASASYPSRPETGSPVWWVGPVAPAFGGTGGAIDGLDYWIGPVA